MQINFKHTAELPEGLSTEQKIALLEALVAVMSANELKRWAESSEYRGPMLTALDAYAG